MVRHDLAVDVGDRARQRARMDRELDVVRAKIKRIMDSMADTEDARRRGALGDKLSELLAQEDQLAEQRGLLEQPRRAIRLPSMVEIKGEAQDLLGRLAGNSPEFGRRIRRLVPSLTVYPYRLIDGGKVVLWARLMLNLAPLAEKWVDAQVLEKYPGSFQHELTVELFDPPAQRALFRERVMAMRANGLSEGQAAVKLGITEAAAQRAAALQRLMDERGLTDPYVLLKEPPADLTKLRRHLHPRYRFQPLAGYPAW